MADAVDGRWCGELVWKDARQATPRRPVGALTTCGGELLYRRRLEGEQLVSYLVCQFCGHQTPALAYDETTREHSDLLVAREL